MEQPLQCTLENKAKCLHQIHKTHIDRLDQPKCWSSVKWLGWNLVLLNPMFNHQSDFLIQHPWTDLSGEAKGCDTPVIGTHPPAPLFMKRGTTTLVRHIKWHCHQCLFDAVKACPPKQPRNIQSLDEVRADLIHPQSPAATEPLTTSATSALVMDGTNPKPGPPPKPHVYRLPS